jgi:hypothetical protein
MNARKLPLWLGWIWTNTMTLVVSHLVTAAAFLLSFAILEEGSLFGGLYTILIGPGVAGGIAGSVVSGILQWSVLRHYTSRAAGWVSIGAAGFAVGYAVTVVLAYLVSFLVVGLLSLFIGPYDIMPAFIAGAVAGCVLGAGSGAVIGAVQGTVQCDLWRQHDSRSGWWVLASTVKLVIELIASGIGAPTTIVIAEVLSSTDPSAALPDLGIPIVIGCLSIVAGGILSGAITGGALTKLLQHPIQEAAVSEPKPADGTADQDTSKQSSDNLKDEPAITGD